MPESIIKTTLVADYTDTTASAISAAYPLLYPTASSVPTYAYTSLATLLGVASGGLPLVIIAALGQGDTPATAAVIIEGSFMCEATLDRDGVESDHPGAEYAEIGILVRNVRYATSINLVKNVTLRIRYLIDYNLRQWRGSPGDLTISGDNSISPDEYFKVFWQKSQLVSASEWATTYKCSYSRSFPLLDNSP